jgi:hypothetical protein
MERQPGDASRAPNIGRASTSKSQHLLGASRPRFNPERVTGPRRSTSTTRAERSPPPRPRAYRGVFEPRTLLQGSSEVVASLFPERRALHARSFPAQLHVGNRAHAGPSFSTDPDADTPNRSRYRAMSSAARRLQWRRGRSSAVVLPAAAVAVEHDVSASSGINTDLRRCRRARPAPGSSDRGRTQSHSTKHEVHTLAFGGERPLSRLASLLRRDGGRTRIRRNLPFSAEGDALRVPTASPREKRELSERPEKGRLGNPRSPYRSSSPPPSR